MRFLIKKTPDRFLKSVNDEISSILSRNFDNLYPDYGFAEDADKLIMPVEIKEKENCFEIKAELPGVKKEDLDIDMEKSYITINARKEEEKEENTKTYKKSEFQYGEFSRTVYFSEDIDTENTKAKLEHGVLKLEAPKMAKENAKSKKLLVD